MRTFTVLLLPLMLLGPAAGVARAYGKIQGYALRMDPATRDARDYSRPGWGAGVEAVGPLPGTARLLAGVAGVEIANLMSQDKSFQDPLTGLRVEQQTFQHYGRFYLGGQVGSHSSGTLRPYAGLDVALVWYGISTDVVVPSDVNRQNEIRQNLRSRSEVAFGWDASTGLDVNFRDRWSLDFGVRWLHQYGLPQQLGADAVTIQPAYVQYRIGVGWDLSNSSRGRSREP